MQRQHDAYPDFAVAHVALYNGRFGWHLWLGGGTLQLRMPGGIGNLDIVTLAQLVARRLHLWIGLNQLVNGQTVVTGYTKDGFLALYLMQFLEFLRLSQRRFSDERKHCQHEKIS